MKELVAAILDPQDKRIFAALFIVSLLTFGYFYQSGQHNVNARMDQVRAIVEDGALNIDRFTYNTADAVRVGRHIYPNKAPGSVFVALPAWVVSGLLVSALPLSDALADHLTCYLTVWFSVGFLSALLVGLVYAVARRLTSDRRAGLLIALCFGFGTIAFPFSTLYFSHQVAAFFVFAAFTTLFARSQMPAWQRTKIGTKEPPLTLGQERALFVLSGFLAGYAVATEYPAAIASGILGIFVLAKFRSYTAWFVLGGVLGIIPLLAYNYLAFGKLFFIPYSVYAAPDSNTFHDHARGFMGVSLPNLSVLLEITFKPMRGIFFCNPWLLLSFVGVPIFLQRKGLSAEFLICFFISVIFFAFNSAYGTGIDFWGGGASVGPRHILPALPFLVLLVSFVATARIGRVLLSLLGLVSAAIMLMATATEPRVPYEYSNPVLNLFFDNYLSGRLALYHHGIFQSELITSNSVAFNIGKLIGLPGLFELVPLFLVWLAGFYWLWQAVAVTQRGDSGNSGRFGVWVFGAFLMVMFLIPAAGMAGQAILTPGPRGLLASYFEGNVFKKPSQIISRKPVRGNLIRPVSVDEQIIFPWSKGDPLHKKPFSAEWRGYLWVPTDGHYLIGTESDDGSCVYLDRKLLVDNWGVHSRQRKVERIYLNKGYHHLVLRYYNEAYAGSMYFVWARPGEHVQPVPNDFLFLDKP